MSARLRAQIRDFGGIRDLTNEEMRSMAASVLGEYPLEGSYAPLKASLFSGRGALVATIIVSAMIHSFGHSVWYWIADAWKAAQSGGGDPRELEGYQDFIRFAKQHGLDEAQAVREADAFVNRRVSLDEFLWDVGVRDDVLRASLDEAMAAGSLEELDVRVEAGTDPYTGVYVGSGDPSVEGYPESFDYEAPRGYVASREVSGLPRDVIFQSRGFQSRYMTEGRAAELRYFFNLFMNRGYGSMEECKRMAQDYVFFGIEPDSLTEPEEVEVEENYDYGDVIEAMYLEDLDTGEGLSVPESGYAEYNLDDLEYSNNEGAESGLTRSTDQTETPDSWNLGEAGVSGFPKPRDYEGVDVMSQRVFKGRDGKWRWANSGKPVNAPRSGGYRSRYRRY